MRLRHLGCMFLLLVASLGNSSLIAQTATAVGMKIDISTNGYFIEYKDQKLLWFDYELGDFGHPVVKETALLTADSGDSYLFVVASEGGSCGDNAYIFTFYQNEIIQYKFRTCREPWAHIQPNIILTYSYEISLCGALQSRADWSDVPINLKAGAYTEQGIIFKELDFDEAMSFNQVSIRYQQFFNSVLDRSRMELVTDEAELAFCRSLATDASIEEKYKLLLKTRPRLAEIDPQVM